MNWAEQVYRFDPDRDNIVVLPDFGHPGGALHLFLSGTSPANTDNKTASVATKQEPNLSGSTNGTTSGTKQLVTLNHKTLLEVLQHIPTLHTLGYF